MAIRNARVGEKVVFAKDKSSTSPGKRAKEVAAAAKGDQYSYIVEKYWVVTEVRSDGTVQLLTRRGKVHFVSADDPRIRRASWLEKLFRRHRFPKFPPDGL